MKKRWHWEIKIPILTLVYFVIMIGSGMFKSCFFLFMIISFHEMCHCIAATLLKMKVEAITIYPFGMQANIQNLGFYSSFKELIVLIAGPMTHLINPFIFAFLLNLGVISPSMQSWLLNINKGMLIMNLLPIYPLDGGRIINEIIHLFFPYSISEKITYSLSFVNLIFLLFSKTMNDAAGFVVMMFIWFNLIKSMKDLSIVKRQFYRFRLNHENSNKKRIHSYNDLYKNSYNQFRDGSNLIEEKDWLLQQFHENSQQILQKNLNGML